MHGWGLFFFLLFLLVIFAFIGYVLYTQYRARQSGLPPPSWKTYVPFLRSDSTGSATNYPTPRHAGPIEWFRDQIDRLRNRRTARGAYEETAGGADNLAYPSSNSRRGRGVEDDAWDTQVGNDEEAAYAGGPGGYYEEQELGLAPTPGLHSEPYGGGSSYLEARTGYENDRERGRSQNRSPQAAIGLQPQAARQQQQQHSRAPSAGQNPFGDDQEAPSLRSVSPRPEEARGLAGHVKGQGSLDSSLGDSPGSTRKSMFREGL